MKRCARCKRRFPTSEFWRDRHTKDGLFSRCKSCGRNGASKSGSADHRAGKYEIWIDTRGKPPWTRSEVITVLRAETQRKGRAPTAREWRTNGAGKGKAHKTQGRPTESTVTRLFGSWNRALDEAGIPSDLRKRRRSVKRCPQGHWLAGANLYVNPASGSRICRKCLREHTRKYRERQAA